MSTNRTGNGQRGGPRSRRGNTPTPPPIEVSPVVVVPKNPNVTQPMSVATKPSPLVVEAPKAPPREPFGLAASAPPPVVAPISSVSSVTVTEAKESVSAKETSGTKENGHSKENGHGKDNGFTKDRVLAKGSPTLVEFTSSAKQSPLIWQNGLPKIDEPKTAPPAEAKETKKPLPSPSAAEPITAEIATREIATREISTRAERAEEKAEAKHLPESKKDPGASGKSAQVSSEVAERFFEEGARSERDMMASRDQVQSDAGLELDSMDEKAAYKMRPEVRARRARNARYVMWATGFSVLLLVVGLVKHKMARGEQDVARGGSAAAEITAPGSAGDTPKVEDKGPMAAAAAPAAADPQAAPGAAGEVKPAEGKPEEVKPAAGEVKADEAKGEAKADQAKPADPSAAGAAPATDTPPVSDKTAAQEKHDCQVALEHSAFKKSIEAGERSVALDPTDAEAWLLLGAAYQSLGNGAEARRAFSSCLKEGKKGPVGECRAMMR